jgi:hypothetical protein
MVVYQFEFRTLNLGLEYGLIYRTVRPWSFALEKNPKLPNIRMTLKKINWPFVLLLRKENTWTPARARCGLLNRQLAVSWLKKLLRPLADIPIDVFKR